MTHFPHLTARDLHGVPRSLPDDLPSDPTLVILAFRIYHQADVDTWTAACPDLPTVEVPVVDSSEKWMERYIEQGMRAGISDTADRARTWTAYTRLDQLSLGASPVDPSEILAVLSRPNGAVLWSSTGPARRAAIAEVRALLDAAR